MADRAHDEAIGRDVAVKILPPHLASDETVLARFLSEAGSSGRLSHPNVIALYEVNRAGGMLGLTLKSVVDGRNDPESFLREPGRLIDAEKVPVDFGYRTSVGCWTSAARKTVVPLFEDRDHLLVYPVQCEGLEESPNVFYTGPAPIRRIFPALRWAVESLGAKRFHVVASDYVFPRAAAAIIRDAAPGLGIEIVGEDGRFAVVRPADAPVAPEPYPATRSAEVWKAFLRDLHRGWGGRWSANSASPQGS